MKNLHALKAALIAAAILAATQAQAALPSGVDTFFTTLETDFGTLMGYAWPVLLVVTGGFIWMRVGKRAARTAMN